MARVTAASVLSESIQDIKNGHWLCGNLTQAAEANGNKKPDGCAVALVVMNAKLAKVEIVKDESVRSGLIAFCPNIKNPSDYFRPLANSPKSRLAATRRSLVALALAMPVEQRPTTWDEDAAGGDGDDVPMTDKDIMNATIDDLESMVIEYNDSHIEVEEALDWFEQAYKLVAS